MSLMEPSVSPDGNNLFFNVFTKNPNTGLYAAEIWMIRKKGDDWEKQKYTGVDGMGPSVDREGNLYFSTEKDGFQCIGISYLKEGRYSPTSILPEPIYSKKELIHPCVSPDDSWMLFNTENQKYYEDGCGLFVSFKKKDGTWTKPKCVVSRLPITGGPLVRLSSDGKYLFYSQNGDIYGWMRKSSKN